MLERNQVYCMDALELLGNLEDGSVDAVITDPPYGLGGRIFNVEERDYVAVNEEWDKDVPIEWMAACSRVLRRGGSVLCFGGRQSIYRLADEGLRLGWRIVNDITWYKPDAMPNMTGRMMTESTERCLWFCPDGTGWTYNLNAAKFMNRQGNLRDVWTFGQTREERFHPTQKPLRLMERMVTLFSCDGDLVLDPFAGSGTTLVAARNLGRDYIGGDLSPEYVELARKRLSLPYTLPMFEAVTP